MRLQAVGFFRELAHGDPNGPSLKAAIRSASSYPKDAVAAYLLSAPLLVASPGVVRDVLDESKPIVGPAHILTDGVWMWPQDIAHYVVKYNIALPEAFLACMNAKAYRPPSDGDVDLGRLEF